MKKNYITLTANTIREAIKDGRARCSWICVGNKLNQPYEGDGVFFEADNENGFKYLPLSGVDLNYGGITWDGYYYLADYDYGVAAIFSDAEAKTKQILTRNNILLNILLEEGMNLRYDEDMRLILSAKDAALIPAIVERRAPVARRDYVIEDIEEK